MEEIKFTKEETELIELMKYFRDMVVITEGTPPYNRLILQEEIDYFNNQINTIVQFASGKIKYRKAKEMEHYKKWNAKINMTCPWCKTRFFSNPLGEIMLDDGLTYFQYYCVACKMNCEAPEPNNIQDMILFKERYLADLSKPDKDGNTQQRKQGISFEEMKKKREYADKLKKEAKILIDETMEMERPINEFMEYVLNELLILNAAKERFETENGLL